MHSVLLFIKRLAVKRRPHEHEPLKKYACAYNVNCISLPSDRGGLAEIRALLANDEKVSCFFSVTNQPAKSFGNNLYLAGRAVVTIHIAVIISTD